MDALKKSIKGALKDVEKLSRMHGVSPEKRLYWQGEVSAFRETLVILDNGLKKALTYTRNAKNLAEWDFREDGNQFTNGRAMGFDFAQHEIASKMVKGE